MNDTVKPDEELERLESMHERVEKLRSKLRDIQRTSSSVAGRRPAQNQEPPGTRDNGSKKYQ